MRKQLSWWILLASLAACNASQLRGGLGRIENDENRLKRRKLQMDNTGGNGPDGGNTGNGNTGNNGNPGSTPSVPPPLAGTNSPTLAPLAFFPDTDSPSFIWFTFTAFPTTWTMPPTLSPTNPPVANTASPTLTPVYTASPIVATIITTFSPTLPPTNLPVAITASPTVSTASPIDATITTLSPTLPPTAAPVVATITSLSPTIKTDIETTAIPTTTSPSTIALQPTTATTNTPATATPAISSTILVPLLDFSISVEGTVQNKNDLLLSLETYLIMEMPNVIQVTLEQEQRRLVSVESFSNAVFSYSGVAEATTVDGIIESQKEALTNVSAVQDAIETNNGNLTVSALTFQETNTTPQPTETTQRFPILLIAACAAGGAALLLLVLLLVRRARRKSRTEHSAPRVKDKVRLEQLQQEQLLEEESVPPPPPPDEDDFSMMDYSLTSMDPSLNSTITDGTPQQEIVQKRFAAAKREQRERKKQDSGTEESFFDYDQVGANESMMGSVEATEDDIDPASFYGETILSQQQQPNVVLSSHDNKDNDSDVPSDERNVAVEQDLTGFELAKTTNVTPPAATKIFRSSSGTKTPSTNGTKNTTLKHGKKTKMSEKPTTQTVQELDSLSDFLKNRRDAKLASRKSN